jgi:hypothetical protein
MENQWRIMNWGESESDHSLIEIKYGNLNGVTAANYRIPS